VFLTILCVAIDSTVLSVAGATGRLISPFKRDGGAGVGPAVSRDRIELNAWRI
jgi:hypothetical protein